MHAPSFIIKPSGSLILLSNSLNVLNYFVMSFSVDEFSWTRINEVGEHCHVHRRSSLINIQKLIFTIESFGAFDQHYGRELGYVRWFIYGERYIIISQLRWFHANDLVFSQFKFNIYVRTHFNRLKAVPIDV